MKSITSVTNEAIQEIEIVLNSPNMVWIYFKINHFGYNLKLRKTATDYKLHAIYHQTNKKNIHCFCCGEEDRNLCALTAEIEEVFERLVHHPSFRLRWLYKKEEIK